MVERARSRRPIHRLGRRADAGETRWKRGANEHATPQIGRAEPIQSFLGKKPIESGIGSVRFLRLELGDAEQPVQIDLAAKQIHQRLRARPPFDGRPGARDDPRPPARRACPC